MKPKMDPEFTNPPATLEEIQTFENKFNIKLPQDYQDFLLENNGGQIDLSESELAFVYQIRDKRTNEIILGCYMPNFKSLKSIEESLIYLEKNPEDCYYLVETMKRGVLIIGFEEPLEISIGFKNYNFGKVYRSGFTGAWFNNELQLLANSFTEFINGFEEEQEE